MNKRAPCVDPTNDGPGHQRRTCQTCRRWYSREHVRLVRARRVEHETREIYEVEVEVPPFDFEPFEIAELLHLRCISVDMIMGEALRKLRWAPGRRP